MKKNFVKMFMIAVLALAISNAQAQGLRGLINKAKSAVTGDAKKAGKADANSPHATAKPLVADAKNAVSEIRSLTGLTKANFDKKVKSLGYAEATDDTGLFGGGVVYKSKAKGAYITVKMGTRGGESLTIEATKYIYSKSPDFAAMKASFLNFGTQCTDLKAEFTNANVEERGKLLSGVGANNIAKRTAKFLPALDNMISAKKEFFAKDDYSEKDYDYRIIYYYIKVTGAAMVQMTVVDKTVDSLEG